MKKFQFEIDFKDKIEEKLLPLIKDQTNVYKVEKCSKSSTDIRNEGNKLYNLSHHDKKLHLQMLICYTKCIAYAPSGSEELAKGYGNRSMLLFHLEQYDNCIADIDRALSITKLNWLRIKLLVRKVESMALGQLHLDDEYRSIDVWKILNEAKDLVNEVGGNKIKIKDDLNIMIRNAEELVKKLSCKEAAPRIKDVSKKAQFPDFAKKGEIPCASDGLTIRNNTEFGRHLIATRNIKAGEILMIEDGFVHPNPINAYIICSHCLEKTYIGIPCDICVFVVYCSEKCKQDAWTSYHDKECTKYDYYKILKIFTQLNTEDFDKGTLKFMLLRRILILTIKETKDESVQNLYWKFFDSGVNQDKRTRGFKINDRLNGRTLEAFGSLTSQIDEKKILMSFYPFVYMLSTDVLSFESDLDFKMMLHLVTQAIAKLAANSFSVGASVGECVCETDKYEANHESDCINKRGITLAPFCSLLNHSCVHNANYFTVNGKMVLFANRPIKAGEQIFVNYGMPEQESTASERQLFLFYGYRFICNCQACRENWPVFTKEESDVESDPVFLKFVENVKKLDLHEIASKEDIANKVKALHFDSKKLSLDVGLIINKKELVDPNFLFQLNCRLYAASKTIHDVFAKNTFQTFIKSIARIQNSLKSFISREVLCYDEEHFKISDNCSKIK